MFSAMVDAGTFEFSHSVHPDNTEKLILVRYHDGADPAYACSIYCVWKVEQGHEASLLAAKARINTKKNSSAPRSEMNGLVILCHLSTATIGGLVKLPEEIVLVGDSECTIATVVVLL